MQRRLTLWAVIILFPLFLAACDSAEERAQKHFEKGMVLLEEGDVDRALIEFRNVFKLDGTHKEARLAYAQVEELRGNIQGSYDQYLQLVEQYPENVEGRRALARLAAGQNNWEEVERHLAIAEEQAPQDPLIRSLRVGLDYSNALRDSNLETAALAVTASANLLQDHPDLPVARRIVIDDLLRHQDWESALAAIDAGLEVDPSEHGLYMLRLGILEQLERNDEIVIQLKDMVTRFPDAGLHRLLVNQYTSQDRLKEAEAYLGERAEQGGSDAQLELIYFLAQQVSSDAAIEKIDQFLAQTDGNRALLRTLRAGLDFEAGNRDAAILEMEDILKGAEPSEETDRIKVTFAHMLKQTGDSAGARAQVEEVLEHDPTQTGALKLKAAWLTEDDQAGDALVELRRALDQSPRDPVLMSLMAQAHERSGNPELMGEMLALAVEASNSAPEESLRYVRFLIQEEKLLSAEGVLQDALRFQNTNLQLLSALGSLYIRMEDWSRTQNVIATLTGLGSEQAQALANELTARRLAGQNRAQELEQFLTGLANGESRLQAAASIIRLRLAQGDTEGALIYATELLEQDPGNPTIRFLQAGVLISQSQQDEAATILKELSDEYPTNERIWLALYRLERSRGEGEAASQVLAKALAASPESADLQWVAAEEAEQRGDIDAAIAIYEDLYRNDSNSVVIANNLASLMSTYREDDASVQKAYDIVRRLRGTEIPAFQDTYGWIAQRLGNHREALTYLEPAAASLSDDPTVQYHLAETYTSLGRDADAFEQHQKVVALVQDRQYQPPFMDRVEAEIKRLSKVQN